MGGPPQGIQADKSATRVAVRVLPHDEVPTHITKGALGTEPIHKSPPTREQTLAELLAREPNMSYDDWRIEVMGLVNGEF